jgi:hypothetical protein
VGEFAENSVAFSVTSPFEEIFAYPYHLWGVGALFRPVQPPGEPHEVVVVVVDQQVPDDGLIQRVNFAGGFVESSLEPADCLSGVTSRSI